MVIGGAVFALLIGASIRIVAAGVTEPASGGRRPTRSGNALYDECYDVRHMLVAHMPPMAWVMDNPTLEELQGKSDLRDVEIVRSTPVGDVRIQYRNGCRDVQSTVTVQGLTSTMHASFDEPNCRYESSTKMGVGQNALERDSWYDFATHTGHYKEVVAGGKRATEMVFSPAGDCRTIDTTETMFGQVDHTTTTSCKGAHWYTCEKTNALPAPAPGVIPVKVFKINPMVSGATSADAYSVWCEKDGACTSIPATVQQLDRFLDEEIQLKGELTNERVDINTYDLDAKKLLAPAYPGNGVPWSFISSVRTDAATGAVDVDPDHKLGQVNAFHHANKLIDAARAVGGWYPKSQAIIFSHATTKDNASATTLFDGHGAVSLGYIGPWETAFDGPVVAHEVGHVNFQAASPSIHEPSSTGSCAGGSCVCTSAVGCIGAISEGGADVQAFLTYDLPLIGQFFRGDQDGFVERNATRNATLTCQQAFKNSAEVHNLGGLYNAIWWDVRQVIGLEAARKLFLFHLRYLDKNSTLVDDLAMAALADRELRKAGDAAFATGHQREIQDAFAKHGIDRTGCVK